MLILDFSWRITPKGDKKLLKNTLSVTLPKANIPLFK